MSEGIEMNASLTICCGEVDMSVELMDLRIDFSVLLSVIVDEDDGVFPSACGRWRERDHGAAYVILFPNPILRPDRAHQDLGLWIFRKHYQNFVAFWLRVVSEYQRVRTLGRRRTEINLPTGFCEFLGDQMSSQ